ncbi:hypothetical protein [Bosea sp. TAB14]|uniref:hypothetical protein n=1 Tax=Bosea sp. TAB14 TaxID=3237481 RepID=UPI003F8F7FF1
MAKSLHRNKVLLERTRATIDQSPRPTDALLIDLVAPFFVVHLDHLDGWASRIDAETLQRLPLFARPNVLLGTEEEIQRSACALDPKERVQFRAGIPVFKVPVPIDIRPQASRGGRTKDVIEIALREALAVEVFRCDIELRAIEALRARREGRSVDPTDIPEISTLANMVWVNDFPTKGRKVKANRKGNGPADSDAWCDVFKALHDEGRKIAVARTVGASRPEEVQRAIIADIFSQGALELTAAASKITRRVELMMRGYREATRATELKHKFSKRQRKHLARTDGRRRKAYDPTKVEIMTKREHSILTQNSFSAKELAEIAFLADVDVNLLCMSHVLASPEFAMARKLGRWAQGKDLTFDAREIFLLDRLVVPENGRRPPSVFAEVHELLADYALDVMPFGAWRERLAAARTRH